MTVSNLTTLRDFWLLVPALLLAIPCPGEEKISAASFRHHFITRDLPRKSRGDSGYGTPALADFDRDGDLDFACSTPGEMIYWFENRGGGEWLRHVLAEIPLGQLAACALDVDGDGWMDLVTGGFWYRNPREPRSKEFIRRRYDASIRSEVHDLVAADIDGDGRADVVALGDREGCFWYGAPPDPLRDADWRRTAITDLVLDGKDDIHAGFSPRGAGDLDGDGDADLVLPDRWLESSSRGAEWKPHPLPFGKRGPWGLSSRSWIADLDRDGDQDIVIVDGDQKESRAAWLESDGSRPPRFTVRFLPIAAPGKRGSFHSLAVVDLDGDGDLDIVTAEQEDPSILPAGAAPRWYAWENLDGRGQKFEERVILDAGLGGHDLLAGDIDGDGDIDLAAKIWRRWPGNSNGGRFHADWLENLKR